jgi:glucokinase
VLDSEKGTLFAQPARYFSARSLGGTITNLTGLPTVLLNDVRAITNGEWRFGAGRGVDTVAVFAVGTGIGGGLVINGQLHLGIGGTGGELGHMTIDYSGPVCGCGNKGCLETFSSGPAIAAMGMKAVTQGLTTRIGEMCEYDLNRITPELIAQAARAGDQISWRFTGTRIYLGTQQCLRGRTADHWWRRGTGGDLLAPIRRTLQER